ncbi:uracil/xanthine transporter [Alkalihalophilus lindianensis]|uniref:Uracil/xanthine transporter n=1 Tax=Alkalihalophilus lindianensis TaxID=1630542 RepID=A0ABU3XGN2_9BACI|nr:uracil/xanthine transporter [Alkalihalophilus lindianensis]MDV2686564.1 uracil/xanthine transporter [Alkalihalophilus lindianensis]
MKNWTSAFTLTSSIQWLFFIFANTIVVPLSIAVAFEVPPDTVKLMLSGSLIFTGLACVIQGLFGHRYPLMEGHSGLLWGVMLNLGLSASAMGMSYSQIGGGLATGILLAGVVTILLVLLNLIQYVQRIFTPMVMSVYLFLLTFQLIFVFFQGMLGITEQGKINIPVSILSLVLVIFVSVLKIKGSKTISNFSILIGIVVGWICFVWLFPNEAEPVVTQGFSVALFPLGTPNLEYGIIAVAFFAGILNLTNTVASIQAAAELFKEVPNQNQYKRSFFWTGFFSIIVSGFGLVPYTPFTSSIGFLQSTQIYKKEPFLIAGGILSLVGLIPPVTAFLITLPISVGNAVLFVAYLQLFGTAFNSLKGEIFTSNTIFRLAGPLLIGVSLMTISPQAFSDFPILLQPILSNGLIMGVVISIFLEELIVWEKVDHYLKKAS